MIWLVEFLDRSDISYTNPGRKDSVYIGKINGESQYMQKKYLLWPLRKIVSIANSQEAVDESFESKFGKILTFSQLYDFLKGRKEYVYNINIPHASCLCEICENSSLLAKGLNKLKRSSKHDCQPTCMTWLKRLAVILTKLHACWKSAHRANHQR